jgi:hypothetical protein
MHLHTYTGHTYIHLQDDPPPTQHQDTQAAALEVEEEDREDDLVELGHFKTDVVGIRYYDGGREQNRKE